MAGDVITVSPVDLVRVHQAVARIRAGVDELNRELDGIGAQAAVDLGPHWLRVALQEFGVRETRGGETPRILEYLSVTGLAAGDRDEDEVPWCAAFVGWCLEEAEQPSTRSALARSYLTWGAPSGPHEGAIVVLRRGSQSWQGHVGFVLARTDERVLVLGGNQGDAVSLQWFPAGDVLGYRWAG